MLAFSCSYYTTFSYYAVYNAAKASNPLNNLFAQGLIGVVPQSEMDKELHRRIIIKFEARKRFLAMQFIFNKCLLRLVRSARKRDAAARKHRFEVLAGKCFYAWSDHIYLVGLGLDRKRWPGPRKYEVILWLIMDFCA